MHPTPDFCVTQRKIYHHVGIFWRYPRRQSPTPTLKFALPPTPTPDASQWNIAGVGSQRKMLALAMYISFFLCRFHLRLYPTRTQFPVEYGLYICFYICKALQSLIFGVFLSKGSYKVLFLLEKKDSELRNVVLTVK